MTELWDLPRGWLWATMGDVAKVVGGSTPKTSEPSYWGGDIPWITPDDLSGFTDKYIERGRRNITQAGYDSCSTQMVPAETVLFTSRAPIGYVAIARNPVCTNQGFKSFVCAAEVRPAFVYWWLRASKDLAASMASGTTFPELSAKAAARLPVPIPPLAEQDWVVYFVEEQMSRLAAATEGLDRGATRLNSLRTAFRRVALMSGDDSWRRVTLPAITKNRDGQRIPVRKSDRVPGPFPYYGASGVIDHVDRYLFDGEYLLVAEDGANLLSRSSPIAFRASGRFWVNNHAHVLEAGPEVDLGFLELWLDSLDLTRYVTGTAQPKLTQAALNRIEVRLPSVDDQRLLVDRVARQVSVADAATGGIDNIRARAKRLKAEVLRAAFSGKFALPEQAA